MVRRERERGRRGIVLLLIGLLIVSGAGVYSTFSHQETLCDIRRDNVVMARQLVHEIDRPLAYPASGDPTYFAAIARENVHRSQHLARFLASHPVPSCS